MALANCESNSSAHKAWNSNRAGEDLALTEESWRIALADNIGHLCLSRLRANPLI